VFKSSKPTIDWKLSIHTVLLAICIIDSSGSSALDRVASAQSFKPSQKSPTTQPARPDRSSWVIKKIEELLQPKRKPLGSRGDDMVCAESPTFRANYPYLWTRQPLLVWSGSPSSLQLLDAQSLKIVWQKAIDSNSEIRQVRIDRPLELGKRYIWRVVAESGNDAVNPEIAFQIVDANQWRKIDRELKALEQKLKEQKLSSDEIILEKVKYFAQYQMWGDAQETLAILPSSLNQNQQVIDLKKVIKDELGLCLYNSIHTPSPNEKK
jgi:Domain of Unknown Function (DUF928)